MCPACIEGTAVIVAGAASTGGILAVWIGKFRKFFTAVGLGLLRKQREGKEAPRKEVANGKELL